MNLHTFIFTEKASRRRYRHIIFWLVRYLFILSSNWMSIRILGTRPRIGLPLTLLVVLGYEILYTYVTTYYLLPRLFMKKKYLSFSIAIIVYTLLIMALMAKTDQYLNHPGAHRPVTFLILWGAFWSYAGYGPPSICGLFLVIRMVKLYYIKTEEKEVLIRETANAESQLLKARVHPHFLFNTLNNIYSYSYDRPADAIGLAESLSGTMHYMITDCEASMVPLEKELKMINDYIQLEKARYGHRLSVNVLIDGDPKNKMIAPLLMIPFIENAFKHGASQMMEGSWIKMTIFIGDAVIRMEVSNNNPLRPIQQHEKKGIGLSTVRKRLQLLYPGSHSLKLDTTSETFRILVELPLQINTAQPHEHIQS